MPGNGQGRRSHRKTGFPFEDGTSPEGEGDRYFARNPRHVAGAVPEDGPKGTAVAAMTVSKRFEARSWPGEGTPSARINEDVMSRMEEPCPGIAGAVSGDEPWRVPSERAVAGKASGAQWSQAFSPRLRVP